MIICFERTQKRHSNEGTRKSPNYLHHPWSQLTHHPKRHPNSISHFSTTHQKNRQTDRLTDKLTDGPTSTNTLLHSINDSNVTNNYYYKQNGIRKPESFKNTSHTHIHTHTHTHTYVPTLCSGVMVLHKQSGVLVIHTFIRSNQS